MSDDIIEEAANYGLRAEKHSEWEKYYTIFIGEMTVDLGVFPSDLVYEVTTKYRMKQGEMDGNAGHKFKSLDDALNAISLMSMAYYARPA